MTDAISLHVPSHDDWDDFYLALCRAFNEELDEAASAAERHGFEPERGLVARRGGQILGTAMVTTRQLATPGALVPAGHVTFVSVAPTARRQGILTRLMHRQFEDIAAAGEPIAVLWASEGRIYQRFGYGLASRVVTLQINTREIVLPGDPKPAGRLHDGGVSELRDMIVKIYDQAAAHRPGWSERGPRQWDGRLSDPASWRRGGTSLRVVVHEGEHGPDGYALYRVAAEWNDEGPNGQVRIVETVATTPEAYLAIWRYLLTIDLTRTATYRMASIHEPLQYLVNEPRQLSQRVSDALWVRIIDLPAALAARRYATDIDVVLEVSDEHIPANAGRWRLTGSPTSAHCGATTDPADLRLDIRVLASAYLGGSSLMAYGDGGQVTELHPGALAAATTAFGWHRPPSTLEVF